MMQGRDFVLPDDVKAMAVPVLAHRLILRSQDGARESAAGPLISELLDRLPVPGATPGR